MFGGVQRHVKGAVSYIFNVPVKDTIQSQKTGGEQTTIEGLGTYKSYYIKVSAFTKVGNGLPSQKIICTTAEDGEKYFTTGRET